MMFCNVTQEVRRIKKEHPDDALAIENERVKGYLKVTRAFGAGFLKEVYFRQLQDLCIFVCFLYQIIRSKLF